MRIRARLILNAILGIMFALCISIVLWVSNLRISQANQTVTAANQLTATLSNMRLVTFDYLLNRTDRALEQWQDTYNETVAATKDTQHMPADQRTAAADIYAQSTDIYQIFNRLTTDFKNPASDPSLASLQVARDKQLTDQLLLKQQIMMTDSLKLGDTGQQHIRQAMRSATIVVVVVVVALLAGTLVNIWLITFAVGRGLARLQRGAAVFATGKLDYRLGTLSNDEFGELAERFNTMASRLEATEQTKTEFILLASHQLRMPLTAISWIVDELLHAAPSSPGKQRQYIHQIYESDKRMIKLVDDLLNVARIGFGSLSPEVETVDVAKVLNGVIREMEPQLNHKHLEIIQSAGKSRSIITSDPNWIRAILQNLISNAIKYSHPNQHITVSFGHDRAQLIITVQDQGIGIPFSEQDQIFTKMFRGEKAKDIASEGTGIGLYITKSMVDLMGGAVWFESEEDKGSTFYVRLPKDATPARHWRTQ